MNRITFLLLLSVLSFNFSFSQIAFENETLLNDRTLQTSEVSDVFAADLNNDGFKDLIVGSNYANNIIWYKNVDGNLQYESPKLIATQVNIPKSIYSSDLDGDGLADIIVASQFDDKVIWYKNLGNDEFSEEIFIGSFDSPQSVIAEDLNNDGNDDILISALNEGTVYCLFNAGNATFFSPQPVFISTDSYGPLRADLADLDNDTFLDLIFTQSNGGIYWSKNLGNSAFADASNIGTMSTSSENPEFIDLNADGFKDVIYNSNDQLVYNLNLQGNSFSGINLLSSQIPSQFLVVEDIDNDGDEDIAFTANNTFKWIKNNNNIFNELVTIATDLGYPKGFLLLDLENDGTKEFIGASYSAEDLSKSRLSYFKLNQSEDAYEETILDIYLGAIRNVKVFDVDNDGLDDVVSGYKYLVWNKNMGNGIFSSLLLLSDTSNEVFAYRLEVADMNGDNLKDIVAIVSNKLEIYKNEGDGRFTMIYNINLISQAIDLELADVNNDNLSDIFLVFAQYSNGVGKIINSGAFAFNPISYIVNSTSGLTYMPSTISSGDVDNDGDTDLISGSYENSKIHMLQNDGLGNFAVSEVQSGINADVVELVDINNDEKLDIIGCGSNTYNAEFIYYKLGINNGTFASEVIIDDSQSLQSVEIGDLNNDGLVDIVGAQYEYYGGYDEKLIAYVQNGISFDKHIIDSLGDAVSLERSVALGDLNGDDKLDVITGHYFIGRTSYYANATILGLDTPVQEVSSNFYLYPNPTKGEIFWPETGNTYDVIIYNELGQVVLKRMNHTEDNLNLKNLENGLYFIKFKIGEEDFLRKVIKK